MLMLILSVYLHVSPYTGSCFLHSHYYRSDNGEVFEFHSDRNVSLDFAMEYIRNHGLKIDTDGYFFTCEKSYYKCLSLSERLNEKGDIVK